MSYCLRCQQHPCVCSSIEKMFSSKPIQDLKKPEWKNQKETPKFFVNDNISEDAQDMDAEISKKSKVCTCCYCNFREEEIKDHLCVHKDLYNFVSSYENDEHCSCIDPIKF